MKLTHRNTRATLAIVSMAAAAVWGPTCAQAQARYDFAYQSSDPRILVFDDGQTTRIQLPEGVIQPTIVAVQTQGELLLPLQQQSPYYATTGMYQRLLLKWGNDHTVNVQYIGSTALATRKGHAVAYGAAAPQQVFAATVRPVPVPPGGTPPTMPVIAAAPVPAAPTPVAQTPPPSTPPAALAADPAAPTAMARFDFRPSDQTISGTVQRWARADNYTLAWELPEALNPAIKSAFSLTTATSLSTALDMLVQGMQAKGYPVSVSIGADRVIHFRLDARLDADQPANS